MNPYAASLGSRDPIEAMADTPSRIRTIVSSLGRERLEQSHAPGKWTAIPSGRSSKSATSP